MDHFLSDPWFDDLTIRARAVTDIPADLSITICQTVLGERGATWHVVVDAGLVDVRRGPLETVDVSLTTDFETALGIHRGTVSAPRAFLNGDLRVGGDMKQLMAKREHLVAILLLVAAT